MAIRAFGSETRQVDPRCDSRQVTFICQVVCPSPVDPFRAIGDRARIEAWISAGVLPSIS